jgi:dihydrodipicolinate synthase/N-acetylneuraminate lyase
MSELLALAKRRSPAANDLQTKLTGIAAHVESHGIGGVKAAAGHIGLRPGIPRLPLTEVSVQTIEQSVLAALRKAT